MGTVRVLRLCCFILFTEINIWSIKHCFTGNNASFPTQLPAGEGAGRPTAAIRRWNWRKSSCSILTWPASGASKYLTHWPSPRGRWRSGFRTGGWSGKKNTTKTSFPAAKRNRRKLKNRGKRRARYQKNTHQEKMTRRLPVILNSLLTVKENHRCSRSLQFKYKFEVQNGVCRHKSNTTYSIHWGISVFKLRLFPLRMFWLINLSFVRFHWCVCPRVEYFWGYCCSEGIWGEGCGLHGVYFLSSNEYESQSKICSLQ